MMAGIADQQALKRALRNMVEQVARGPMSRSVDAQTPTWEDRARTPYLALNTPAGDAIACYGIGGYGVAVYG